jgi:hypothetical protein
MKSTSIENIIHYNLGHILKANSDPKKNFRHGLYLLKNTDNFTAKFKTVEKLSGVSVNFNKYVYGNPMPSEIESIGVAKSNFFTKELLFEIEWLLITARKYHAEISLFLNFKADFENNFLLGNYKEALEAIESTEKIVGVSLWSISSKFLLYEYTASQTKAKLLQTEVLEKNKDGTFTASLVTFLSHRSERRLSAYRYDADLKNALNSVKSNLSQPNKDYYNFQLNFFETIEFNDIKDVLCFDYCNPIVDRYLTYRRAIIYCVSNSLLSDEIMQKVFYLNKKLKDDLFGTMSLFFDDDFKDKDFFDAEYLQIIDSYYTGLYDEVCSKIKTKLGKDGVDFSLVNLYSRALVLGKNEFTPLIDNPSVLNEIAEYIYKIHNRNSNPAEALYGLYQISKNIDAFDINYGLSTYIKGEQNIKHNPFYYFLGCKKADPIVAEMFDQKPDVALKVLEKIMQNSDNSVSVAYRKQLINGDIGIVEGIDANKLEIDKAKSLYKRENYDEALTAWTEIFQRSQDKPPVLEAAVQYIFKILSVKEKYDETIRWYVDSVLRNQFLVFKINAENVHKALKKGRFKIVENNIYLPIFVSLVSPDENEKAFAIEMYCKSKGAMFPSQYTSTDGFVLTPIEEMFLHYSCNNETLNNYKRLNTTKKRIDERISICNFLAQHDTPNKQGYIEELNLLTNELIIHEGTQKLDESKIYANDQAILNKELDEFEGLYNRYNTIAGLIYKNHKILTLNKNELRLLDKKGEMEYSQNEIEYSDQADIDSFYNIFSVIREKFLFSKFGIVTYLSTRIRHGVLLGELRPELEKSNLIFFKSKLKDKYEPTAFWLNNARLSEGDKTQLIQLISDFSAQIDDLINMIIKENIQIKLAGDHENGWFNYQFSIDELSEHSFTLYYSEDYKDFCKKALEILWLRTNENLEAIKTILQNEIKPRFVDIINEFDGQLHKLLGQEKMPEIFTAVNMASTTLQNKIDKISTWFNRSGKTHSDFRLDLLVGIICKNLQKAHPQKMLKVNSDCSVSFLIKGEFHQHFSDFIRIFIENIYKHTTGRTIDCLISIRIEGNDILMVFENGSLSADSDLPTYRVEQGVALSRVKLLTEGKSGIVKAIKTVKDDLKNESNDLTLEYVDNKFRVTVRINFENLQA